MRQAGARVRLLAAAMQQTGDFILIVRKGGIIIEMHLPDDPLIIEASRNGIQQVLTNLLLNAEYAARTLPGQGTVTVRAWGDGEGVHERSSCPPRADRSACSAFSVVSSIRSAHSRTKTPRAPLGTRGVAVVRSNRASRR